jgi:hypothetical protein
MRFDQSVVLGMTLAERSLSAICMEVAANGSKISFFDAAFYLLVVLMRPAAHLIRLRREPE